MAWAIDQLASVLTFDNNKGIRHILRIYCISDQFANGCGRSVGLLESTYAPAATSAAPSATACNEKKQYRKKATVPKE
jgi:hypothetical protein